MTDKKGYYELKTPPGKYTLVIQALVHKAIRKKNRGGSSQYYYHELRIAGRHTRIGSGYGVCLRKQVKRRRPPSVSLQAISTMPPLTSANYGIYIFRKRDYTLRFIRFLPKARSTSFFFSSKDNDAILPKAVSVYS